jgi:hypothetical protein
MKLSLSGEAIKLHHNGAPCTPLFEAYPPQLMSDYVKRLLLTKLPAMPASSGAVRPLTGGGRRRDSEQAKGLLWWWVQSFYLLLRWNPKQPLF